MVTLHTPCNKMLEVRMTWTDRTPAIYVYDRRRDTCPVCGDALNFYTMHRPRSLDELTPDELRAWFDSTEPIPF